MPLTTKKEACKECPYRKDSIHGWLGGSSGDPEGFLQQLNRPNVHPCHKEVNWEDEENLEASIQKANVCTGALQFMNNDCKLSRFPEVTKLQDDVEHSDQIFRNRRDFIKHHSEF